MRTGALTGLVLCLVAGASACRNDPLEPRYGVPLGGPEAGVDAATNVAPADGETLSSPGPHGIGTKDFVFVDSSRPTPENGTYPGDTVRTLHTKVWYPAPAGTDGDSVAVADDGPFPVILYAHGFLSSREEAPDLKRHLASHGYVVIAPDFPLSNGGASGGATFRDLASQPADLAFALSSVSRLTALDAALASSIDLSREGVAGLSLGGATTLLAAYHPALYLPSVRAAIAFAPAACFFGPAMYQRSLPTVIVSGSADELVPFDALERTVVADARGPLQVIRLEGATHTGFLGFQIPDAGNTDTILGCPAVTSAIAGDQNPAWAPTLSAELDQGTTGGVLNLQGCGQVCGTKFSQSMSGARQLELTRQITLAHFEALLRGRADAARFLKDALDPTNDDVTVVRAR